MNPDSADARHLASIRSDTDLVSAAVRTGDLSADVPSCPGWTLKTLVEHLGGVHRWATHAIRHGVAPGADAVRRSPEDGEPLEVWIVDGATDLIDAIAKTDPTGDTWHPFPIEKKNWVWSRRQAIETVLHRWDAQRAIGIAPSIDPGLASEGIQEFFEIGIPGVLKRGRLGAPSASLHVHCTDVDGEWLIWGDSGDYRMLPVHDKGDAALRGDAASLLLVLHSRLDRDEVDVVGDPDAAAAWLDLPGW